MMGNGSSPQEKKREKPEMPQLVWRDLTDLLEHGMKDMERA